MKNKFFLFPVLGLVSGYLSLHAPAIIGGGEESTVFYAPGWIFGIIISVLLYFLNRKNIFLHLLFIAISSGAYYLAIQSLSLFSSGDIDNTALLTAGVVGSVMLALGLRLMYPIHIKYLALIVIVGGLAGVINPDWGIFPIWQTAVASAIGYAVYKTKYISNPL